MMHSHAIDYSILAVITSAFFVFVRLKQTRIPNALWWPGVVYGLMAHLVWDGWHGCLLAAITGVVAGVFAFGIYTAGGLGAGDSKLLMVLACIDGPICFVRTVFFTILLALIAAAILIPAMRVFSRQFVDYVEGGCGRFACAGWSRCLAMRVKHLRLLGVSNIAVMAAGCLLTLKMTVIWEAA